MYAEVIVDLDNNAVDKIFDYHVPEELDIQAGMRCIVPFGKMKVQGFIIAIKEDSNFDKSKIKDIESIVDNFPVIKPEFFEILNFMVGKYHLKKASVIRLFIPNEMREGKVSPLIKEKYMLNPNANVFVYRDCLKKNAKNLLGIIEHLEECGEDFNLPSLFSSSAVNKLKNDNIIIGVKEEIKRAPEYIYVDDKNIKLTELQSFAIEAVKESGNYLLHGVTGSGKTEVYMHLISRVLKQGKTAIMLVPEISLTPQVLSGFKARFGDMVAILHSGLSAGERFDEWRRLFLGEAKVAIGARSAIFAPLSNLGIIIIDEEHEQSYVSESNPRYSTHDVANMRARWNACPLVLGSATPSIVSYNKAEMGEYKLIELPVRVNGKSLPRIQIVDMLTEIRLGNTGIFSSQFLDDLHECIHQKKQAMLFINRRGYSSFMMCRECGYVAKCNDCDVSLVYHKEEDRLKCHYCGKQYRALTVCPECKSKYIRQGAVGTERVVFELKKIFPDVKILRMDNDTTSKKNAHAKILEEFKNSKPGILVGTQMIAKGHDFSDVTLVGIIDADQSLYHSDYRSTERTFQLITQVSGRAGRSEFTGKVVLQTYAPKHYVYRFAANYDYKGFYKKEINLRETTSFPPFSVVLRVLFSGENEENVRNALKICYNKVVKIKEEMPENFFYLDAMKSPLKRISKKYRYQILARFRENKGIEDLIFNTIENENGVNIFYELEPQNLS